MLLQLQELVFLGQALNLRPCVAGRVVRFGDPGDGAGGLARPPQSFAREGPKIRFWG